MTGRFITLEGIEGSGKTTQARRLAGYLRDTWGGTVETLREPGGSPIAEAIRTILLDPANKAMAPMTELLLYEAARAQLTVERIRPALAAGHTVICDRFADSTTAYQGAARGLGVDTVVPLHALATGGVLPQLTLVLDLSAEEGLQRAASARDKDRLELEPLAFHRRVRAGFLEIAGREPERVRLIDARGAEDDVAKRIQAAVEAQWSARP